MRASALRFHSVEYAAPRGVPFWLYALLATQYAFISGNGRT